jgi:hypothetical protein
MMSEDNNKINYLNIFIVKSYDIILFSIGYAYKTIVIFINVAGIYLIWILLHYLASHLYVRLCVPNTIEGFIMSPFMVTTPQCQSLRWIVYNGSNIISNMWILLGTWICSVLLSINQ